MSSIQKSQHFGVAVQHTKQSTVVTSHDNNLMVENHVTHVKEMTVANGNDTVSASGIRYSEWRTIQGTGLIKPRAKQVLSTVALKVIKRHVVV
uniref:Uncharacterized protein n=1 Tax=Setaria digitata TaxID=48799 RepID=A0A915PRE6_9BILA